MPDGIVFVAGLVVGIVLVYVLFNKSMETRAQGLFEQWRAEEVDTIRAATRKGSRSSIKGKVGEQLAPLLPEFSYAPADARFLGNPVDYVVFDGYTEVKEREAGELREIVFVEVKKGARAELSYEELRIRDCINRTKNVRFEVVRLADVIELED